MALFTMIVAAAVTLGASAAVAGVVATVAVGAIYVGMAGLALKIVGAVTGNKTLTKIGTYMGYVGLAGGIMAAGVVGAAALTDAMSGPLLGTLSTQGATEGSTQLVSAGTDQAAKLAADAVTNASPALDPNAINPVWGNTLAAQQGTLGTQVTAPVPEIGVSGQGFETNDYGAASSPQPEAGAQAAASASAEAGAQSSIAAPGATVTGSPADPSLSLRNPMDTNWAYGKQPGGVGSLLGPQQEVTTPGGEQSWADWWKKVDPSVKAMGGLAAGQTLAGAAQGWFAGQSAEEKLKLETLMNEQKQTELQRRIFNASFAPKVVKSSSTGMLQQGGA